MKTFRFIFLIAAFLLIFTIRLQGQTAESRIVYKIPDMENVAKQKGIVYNSEEGINLKFDLYSPMHLDKSKKLPLVIFIDGYPDSLIKVRIGAYQKDLEWIISWSELIASSGMIAVAYESQKSHYETDSLIKFLQKHADTYNIDINRIAIFGCSANTLSALSILQDSSYNIKCAILYYGILITPDQKLYINIDSAAKQFGFYWKDLREIKKISPEVPLFIVRAGQDGFQVVKETTDYFVKEITRLNIPFTLINYTEGHHAFDILDDTPTSRRIIKQTIDFLQFHLLSK